MPSNFTANKQCTIATASLLLSLILLLFNKNGFRPSSFRLHLVVQKRKRMWLWGIRECELLIKSLIKSFGVFLTQPESRERVKGSLLLMSQFIQLAIPCFIVTNASSYMTFISTAHWVCTYGMDDIKHLAGGCRSGSDLSKEG